MESPTKNDIDEIERYENLRKHNLEDNKIMLKKLMLDCEHLNSMKPIIPPKKSRAQYTRRHLEPESFIRRNPCRRARVAPSRFDLPFTRGRSSSVSSTMSSTSSSSSPMSTPEKLVVKFGFFKRTSDYVSCQDLGELSDDEEADIVSPHLKCKPKRRLPAALCVSEITQEHIDMVAKHTSDKKYDSENGSTCHQCRQKTDDMKTICRSPECFGVKGQFCGPCLRNRYGEDAKLALKDPDWICPPCRGICNCSFCLKHKGRSCTGILIHMARKHGYTDVNSYLSSFRKPQSQE